MPELPEVETIRRGLSRSLIGKKLKKIEIRSAKQFQGQRRQIINTSIKGLHRQAKVLLIEFTGATLAIHLKMSGQLVYQPKSHKGGLMSYQELRQRKKDSFVIGGHPGRNYLPFDTAQGRDLLPNKYTRAIFTFTDGSQLFFNDVRRFGWLKILNEQGVVNLKNSFGPDALSVSLVNFRAVISRGQRLRLKALLLDQHRLAGIGNIYADESCFCARLHPARRVGSLTDAEIKRLHRCLQGVLNLSLKHQGTSDVFYRTASGGAGTFGKVAKVYRRAGQACRRCGHKLVRLRLIGRGTHLCPKCQRLKI